MKILNLLYLIFAILFGILGVVQCMRWSNSIGFKIIFLLNFLPAVAFIISYGLSRIIKRKFIHFIVIPLCLLLLIICGFMTIVVEIIFDSTTEVTNVSKYEKILNNRWKSSDKDLVSHFPEHIPSEARDVRFAYFPGFLQAGAYIQIRYSLPGYKITEMYDYFSERKTKSFFGGDTNNHMNVKGGMPTTFFYTNNSSDYASSKGRYEARIFPSDYEIMIFDKLIDQKGSVGGYWNHGRSHGIAISKQRNEIIYWAEWW